MKKIRKLGLIILCMLMLVCSVGTLTACQGEKYTISFMVDGEVYDTLETTGDEQITMPTSPTKDGYTFDGWYYDNGEWSLSFANTSLVDTPISSDISIYAKFSIAQYTITYHNIDGATHTNPTSFTIEDTIALTDAEKARYTFLGWYSDAEFTAEVTTISAGTTNIDLYAKWFIAPTVGLAYELSTDGTYYTLTGIGSATDTDIIIPSTYNDKPVKSIGDYAFRECSSVTSIVIPDGVTSIGNSAFSYCSSLTSIVIPDSVTSIGYDAFYGCYSLTSITIPYSVTSIGYEAFSDCTSLTKVNYTGTIDEWVQIEFGYFHCSNPLYYAKNLYINDVLVTEVNITTATKISNYAFYGCNSLTSVVIGEGVTSIGDCAFYYCSSLTSIVIPSSVTSIGDYAFSYCSSLTSITIPDSVTSISDAAFYNCSSLTSVVIGDSVTSIGDYAFEGCSSLTSITIPDSVTSIGSAAFYDCTSLTSIVIPDSVTSIDDYAFYNCSKLTSIKYRGSEQQWSAISKDYAWNYNTGNYSIIYNYSGN